MRIISAKGKDGKDLTAKQITIDMQSLIKEHERAKESDPTWRIFGGVINLNGCQYQVA